MSESLNEGTCSQSPENTTPSEISNRASLGGVPAEVLQEILQYSSLKDQMVLHRTSYGLSTFVAKTFKTYKEIYIHLDVSKGLMTLEEQKPKIVRDKNQKKEKSMKREEYCEIPDLLSALKSILEIKNLKIGKLNIQHGSDDEHRKSELRDGIQLILDKLDAPPHVEEFHCDYDTISMDTFLSLVRRMKVGPLVHWQVYGNTLDRNRVTLWDNLVQSPHWNKLDTLLILGLATNLSLSQIVHIRAVSVINPPASIEEFLIYRDKLRENPHACWHDTRIHNSAAVFEALKPFTPDTSNEMGGSYLCDDGKRLHFRLSPASVKLWKK